MEFMGISTLTKEQKKRTSKLMSRILRHSAVEDGLHMNKAAFVFVDELLDIKKFKDYGITLDDVHTIVEENEKNRFQLMHCPHTRREMIRARQGHSIKPPHIDHTLLDITEILDPNSLPLCFHGTYRRNLDAIMNNGLSRMRRQHIHMAKGLFGEVQSGYRKDCDVLISIDVEKAIKEGGFKFYESGNGVILSEGDDNGCIPPQYFKEIIDLASSSSSSVQALSQSSVIDRELSEYPCAADFMNRWRSMPMPYGGHVITFYSHAIREDNKYASFSNFYAHRRIPFVIPSWCGSRRGETIEVEFSEKSIMLCKASLFGDNFTFEEIKKAKSPAQCKRLGRKVRGFSDKKWNEYLCSIAFIAVYSKFNQIPDIKDILLETGLNLIAEAAPNDKIWGIGLPMDSVEVQEPSRWRGMNILGWALMEARVRIGEVATTK